MSGKNSFGFAAALLALAVALGLGCQSPGGPTPQQSIEQPPPPDVRDQAQLSLTIQAPKDGDAIKHPTCKPHQTALDGVYTGQTKGKVFPVVVDPAGGLWPNKPVEMVNGKWSGVAFIGYDKNVEGEIFKLIMVEAEGDDAKVLEEAEKNAAPIPEIPASCRKLDMIKLSMGKPCK
jgi:hypothetical protein